MSIRWKNIKITDKGGKDYLNFQARKFVQSNCPEAISNIERKSLADVVRVKLSDEKTSLNLEDIKDVLSKALGKIGARLTILEDKSESRNNLPVARSTKNVVNARKTKLKVEFFYTRDPKGSKSRVYLEDSKVTVAATHQETMQPLIEITNKGIADFGVVKPGKYKITVDYPETDRCKYDWIDKKRDVQLKTGTEEIVEFEVEPLYQQVQFIAHCLTTIGHQIFVPSIGDNDKLEEVIESNGKTTTKLKSLTIPGQSYSRGDLVNPKVEYSKAEFVTRIGVTKLVLKKKNPLTNEFWTINDLDPAALHPDKIDLNPVTLEVAFKTKSPTVKTFDAKDLTGEWKSKYHGDVDDLKDIEARVNFVGDTLEKAFAQSNREATVLKVFMIPECFFQGLYGTYISDDAAELVRKLQNLVKDEKWKDWIFSFGTVNRVFLGLQPGSVTGGEKNKTIYEMANHAPVIRGGLEEFDFSGDDSTRLIQKLVNSLELAGEDDLIKDPQITELVKKKEELFKETEEKVKKGELEKKELENETKKIDDIEIKRIRPQAVNEEVQFEATENDEKVARLLEKLLEDNTINSAGLRGDAKENEIKVEIKKLGIAHAVRRIRTSKVENGIFFTWGERLKLYEQKLDAAQELEWKERLEAAEKFEDKEKLEEQKKIAEEKKAKKPLPLKDIQKGSMSMEDYVFACPRKAGPLFKNLAEARKVKSCKRLVFGLEICADHGDWRIIEINKGVNFIGVDIQLVPSAGQKPRKFAARKEGYIFNCDGWNTPPNGGRTLETHLDGPSPFVVGIKQTSPIYPHSAAIKRTTDEIDVGVKECLKPEKIETPSEELSKVIFGYGAGELHFYPLQDLPK